MSLSVSKNIFVILAFFKTFLIGYFYYRSSLLIDFIVRVINVSFLFFLWIKIFQGHSTIGGVTLPEILAYYAFAYIMRMIANPNVGSFIGEQIKSGKMQVLMTRPIHPLVCYFGADLAQKISESAIFTVTVILTTVFIFPAYGFNIGELHIINFIILSMLAMLMAFLMGALVGMLAFWVVNITPVAYGFTQIAAILSGLLVPLQFFPGILKSIVNFLPFRFLTSDPVLALQGKIQGADLYNSIFFAVAWLVVIAIGVVVIWRKGVRRFDAVGQ